MKNKKLIILILSAFFIFHHGIISADLFVGPVAQIKKRIKDLKKHKDEEEAKLDTWEELESSLSGSYRGKNRLVRLNSPYIVNGTVQFIDGETEIEAGVLVYLSAGESILFEGSSTVATLTISGTKDLPVKFTTETQSPSIFTNRGEWEQITITNCTSNITWTEFTHGKTGLKVVDKSTIKNCSFKYNLQNGIIVGDTISNAQYTVSLTNCEIMHNGNDSDNDGLFDTGNGILVNGPTLNLTMLNCSILSNGENAISITKFSSLTVNENNIYANSSKYALSNGDTFSTVSVPNNWWGTISTTTISAVIQDNSDNNGIFGPVTYSPIKTSTVAAAGLE